jgi:hypothetical protein
VIVAKHVRETNALIHVQELAVKMHVVKSLIIFQLAHVMKDILETLLLDAHRNKMILLHLKILVCHRHVDQTLNAEMLMVNLFAHVFQAFSAHHQIVNQNVSSVQNVHMIVHVSIRNVSIHVQELVEIMHVVKSSTIVQFAVAHRDKQEILSKDVSKSLEIPKSKKEKIHVFQVPVDLTQFVE